MLVLGHLPANLTILKVQKDIEKNLRAMKVIAVNPR